MASGLFQMHSSSSIYVSLSLSHGTVSTFHYYEECIEFWMHCFYRSRYPRAHRYESLILRSDKHELDNFVLPFKFSFFFLFSIVSYICRLFYFSMPHPKIMYVYIQVLLASSKLGHEAKVSRRKKKTRGGPGLQRIQNVRIQPISHFLLAYHNTSHSAL